MTQTRGQAAMKTTPPAPRHVWKHAAEYGLAAGLLTWLVPFAHMPVLAAAILTLVVSMGIAASVATTVKSSSLALYAITTAMFPPAWVTYAKMAGRLHLAAGGLSPLGTATLVLVVAAGVLVVAGGALYERHVAESRTAADAQAAYAEAAACREITSYFTKSGLAGVRAVMVEQSRGGRVVHLRLPADGSATLTALRQATDRLAVVMKTDAGAITFAQGKHAAEIFMTLDDSDILAEDVPFPEHDQHLTINKPIGIGLAAVGEVGKILLREIAVFVTGIRGWGKSNLLNVLIAQLSSCVDVVIFCIDMSGGSLAGPWLQPWIDDQVLHNGKAGLRPVIDWVATTREEAWLLLCAADRLVHARREENPAKRRSKLTPKNTKPAVIILGDEVVDIFGTDVPRTKQAEHSNSQMVGMANEVTRQSRAAAVDPIWATQRPTVSNTGSGDLKSHCGLRISLGQVAEMDARSAIPDDDAAAKAIARLKHKGTALVWLVGTRMKSHPVWKIFRLDPDPEAHPEDVAKLARIAARNSRYRPYFDQVDLEALGEDYITRWERSELFQRLAPDPPEQPPAARATAVKDRAAEVKAQLDEFEAMTRDAGTGLGDLAGHAAGFATTGQMQPWELRMHALIADRERMGIQVYEIRAILKREGFNLARETIQRALKTGREKGLLTNRNQRWYPGHDTSQD